MTCQCGFIPFVRIEMGCRDMGEGTPDALSRVYAKRSDAIAAIKRYAEGKLLNLPDGVRLVVHGARRYKCRECRED